jgi:hypothetical protein
MARTTAILLGSVLIGIPVAALVAVIWLTR